ncbi:hypothetical protein [Streptomyces himalayensis]|uniref:hypothetical protein n=1 Tax=Streptomyces himalayensis TaxID=2820085 RepID=UPI001FE74A18|nr:hypothetical protein [Streptomyces himalayensis]
MSAREVAEIDSIRLRVEPYAAELSAEALRGPERPQLLQTVERAEGVEMTIRTPPRLYAPVKEPLRAA